MIARPGIPNVAAQTTQSSDRQKVIGALLIAFSIRALAQVDDVKERDTQKIIASLVSTNIPAWVFLTAVLTIASDFDTTRNLAVAFSFLILVATILISGLEAMNVIQRLINQSEKRQRKGSEA